MSLLTIVQAATDELSLPRPTVVVGNTSDQNVKTLLALANREGKALAKRYNWSDLVTEATHTTLAQENQGVMTTIAPGFRFIINQTIWNRSYQRSIPGSLSPQQWQAEKSSEINGPYQEYRIRGGDLLLIPAPAAGQTVAFEYQSKNWCQNAAGSTTYSAWNADDDTGILDEDLMTLGLVWRFKRAKGLDYAEEFSEYERQVNDSMARDGGKPVLDAGAEGFSRSIYVPEGSWQLT